MGTKKSVSGKEGNQRQKWKWCWWRSGGKELPGGWEITTRQDLTKWLKFSITKKRGWYVGKGKLRINKLKLGEILSIDLMVESPVPG